MQRINEELDYKKQLPSKMRRLLLPPTSNVPLDLWVRAPGLQLGQNARAYKVDNVLQQPKLRDMAKRLSKKFDLRAMTVFQEGDESLSSIIRHHLFHEACETISQEMKTGVLKGMTLHFGPELNAPLATSLAVGFPSFIQMEKGWQILQPYFKQLQRFEECGSKVKTKVVFPSCRIGTLELERFVAQHALSIRAISAIKAFMMYRSGNGVDTFADGEVELMLYHLSRFMPGSQPNCLGRNPRLLWNSVFDVFTKKTGSINAYYFGFTDPKPPATPNDIAAASLTFCVMVLWIFQAYWKATREMDWIVRKESNLAYKEKTK